MYEILEDASPFFIRFRFPGIEHLIAKAKEKFIFRENNDGRTHQNNGFSHYRLGQQAGLELLNMVPFRDRLPFIESRVSYFTSQPGYRHHVHIDGAALSFNFGVDIRDSLCKTSWYDEKDINGVYTITSGLPANRAIVNIPEFLENPARPIKTFVHNEGECVLVNTDTFHDFDNSQSPNTRTILTLRILYADKIKFADAAREIFED